MTIPAPPRTVRLRAAAALWWPFGLVTGAGFVLLTIAIVVLLLAGGGGLPFADARLDASATLAAHDARVTAVTPTSFHSGSRVIDAVHYDYQLAELGAGSDVCYAWAGTFTAGQAAAVELLADAPRIHRLRRSNRALSSFWLPDLAGFVWLPLAALFGYWLIRAYQLRHLLQYGDAVPATVVAVVPTTLVNPPQLRVRYVFTVDGRQQSGGQWVRARAPFGRRLVGLQPGTPVPDAVVAYNARKPARNRLLAVEDLAAEQRR